MDEALPAYGVLQGALVRVSPRADCQRAFNLTANSIGVLCTSTAFSSFGRMDVGAGVVGWDKKTGKFRLLAVHTYLNSSASIKLNVNTYVPHYAEWIESVTRIIFK